MEINIFDYKHGNSNNIDVDVFSFDYCIC